jgi:hypothetical protein
MTSLYVNNVQDSIIETSRGNKVCILLVILTYTCMSDIFLTKERYENVQLCYRACDISLCSYVTAGKKN